MVENKHIAPRKSLGQNFLIDNNIIEKTVNALHIEKNDIVFEIGPGEGALTKILLGQADYLLAIELDIRACDLLTEKFAGRNNFHLVNKDFLKFSFADTIAERNIDISKKRIRVLGNIPYYISGRIFFQLFANSKYLERSVLTVQKEVAQRITAKVSTKEYGILSVLGQVVGTPKLAFDVSPNCFFPRPKVMSSVVTMDFHKESPVGDKFIPFANLVKTAFNQRRKKVSNSIKAIMRDNNIQIDDIPERFTALLNKRAEDLSTDDYLYIFSFIAG